MRHRYLKSDRLFYRRFKLSDADYMYELMGSADVCKYLPGPDGYSREDCMKWLRGFRKHFREDIPSYVYAVFERETNKFVGYAGCFYVKEYEQNEIMYAFIKDAWGKGYATEVAKKMKQLAKRLKLKKLIAFTHLDNIASEKVLYKIGYSFIKEVELWGLTLKYYEMKL